VLRALSLQWLQVPLAVKLALQAPLSQAPHARTAPQASGATLAAKHLLHVVARAARVTGALKVLPVLHNSLVALHLCTVLLDHPFPLQWVLETTPLVALRRIPVSMLLHVSRALGVRMAYDLIVRLVHIPVALELPSASRANLVGMSTSHKQLRVLLVEVVKFLQSPLGPRAVGHAPRVLSSRAPRVKAAQLVGGVTVLEKRPLHVVVRAMLAIGALRARPVRSSLRAALPRCIVRMRPRCQRLWVLATTRSEDHLS
jgi:hypothetical protein